MKAKFITIEGIEGVGKSTAVAFCEQWFSQNNIAHVVTREPGGTPLAERIRDIVKESTDEAVATKAELLLFFASRAQHIERVILPNLKQGKLVLCDRFTDSTYAYQSGGRGVAEKEIAILEKWVQNDLHPDVTILMDAPVEVALKRASDRGALDRFENEKKIFFERVRQAYLDRARQFDKRYYIVDASQTVEHVQKQLVEILDTVCKP